MSTYTQDVLSSHTRSYAFSACVRPHVSDPAEHAAILAAARRYVDYSNAHDFKVCIVLCRDK
jgi:hypothetical protein